MTICVACGETRIGQLEQLVSDPLDPNAHRAHIVAVDAILFEDDGLGETERKQLAETLQALGKIASADAKHVIASNANIGRQLRALATAVERTRVGTPLLNSPLRQQWLRLRGSLFDDAWWFRHSSADPVAPIIAPPEAPSGLRTANGEERTGLDLTLSSLSDLVARAKEDLPNSLDSEPHRQFVKDAERLLTVATVRLGPEPPAYGIDISYKEAHRSAAAATRAATMLVGLETGAPTSSREYLIRNVDGHLRKAKEALAEMR